MFNVCSSMHNTVPFFLFGFWIFQMSKKNKHQSAIKKMKLGETQLEAQPSELITFCCVY